MDIFIILFIVLILAVGLFVFWVFKIVKFFIAKRYKIAIINTSILIIIVFGILLELRIIPLSSANDFKNRTAELTGKQFWSSSDFRHEDISVRGEGFTFEIYKLKPEIAEYFKCPPNSFFQKFPTDNYSLTKWKKTPIKQSEMDKLEFITPMYGNWSENEKRKIGDKQSLVKQIALESGSYYVFDTIIGKDVTMYLIAPKQKLIIWINHNM